MQQVAGFLERRFRHALVRQLGAFTMALAAMSVLLWRGADTLIDGDRIAWVAVMALVGSLGAANHFSVVRRKIGAGLRSERRVASALAGIRGFRVINGVLLGSGGDADHVVVGSSIVVVETKTGRGVVQPTGKGALRCGERQLPGAPIEQARRQARACAKLVGAPVGAVVCVTDMTNPPFSDDDVVVASLKDLPDIIARFSPVAPEISRQRVCDILAARSDNG